MNKYIIPFIFFFSVSCNGQTESTENDQIANAKWYYYSYALGLKAYDKNSKEIQPLSCDIKLVRLLNVNADTTKMFFYAFNKDTLDACSFRPYDLVGITIVENKFYLPIYHTIVLDNEKDESVLKRMKKQSLLLQRKLLGNSGAINPWLQAEGNRRKEPVE